MIYSHIILSSSSISKPVSHSWSLVPYAPWFSFNLCHCSYYASPSPPSPPPPPSPEDCLPEYCSNTKLAINHIALSPRRASPRPPLRPPHAMDWPVRLLGRPLGAGRLRSNTSRLLPWRRWLGGRGSPWAVNHAVCRAPRTQRCCMRSGETRRRPTEHAQFWSGRTDPVLFSENQYHTGQITGQVTCFASYSSSIKD